MKTNDDYTNAFASLVSDAVSLTTTYCKPRVLQETGLEELLTKLREAYAKRIKILNEKDYGRHEVLEKALGQYYGALVTLLNSVAAKWTELEANSNGPLVDLEELSRHCCDEAIAYGLKVSDAAYAYSASLVRAENDLLARAEMFNGQLNAFAKRHNIPYVSGGSWSYSILGISACVRRGGKIDFEFTYWDGVDPIMASIGSLFVTEAHIAEVNRLAQQCFGDRYKVSDDLGSVEIDIPIELEKLAV